MPNESPVYCRCPLPHTKAEEARTVTLAAGEVWSSPLYYFPDRDSFFAGRALASLDRAEKRRPDFTFEPWENPYA